MLQATIKQLPWILALFVLGPIAGHLTGSLRAPDGSAQATLLVSTAPAVGILAGAVTLLFALAVGVFASHLNGCRSGLNAAGIVVAWAAAQTATIDGILRRTQSDAPLIALAVEGLIFGLFAVPIAAIIWRAGLGKGQHGELHPLPGGAPSMPAFMTANPWGPKGLRDEHESLGAGLVRAPHPPRRHRRDRRHRRRRLRRRLPRLPGHAQGPGHLRGRPRRHCRGPPRPPRR
ncbi:MAG: hypothetical protein HND58_07050 [Planctomycetota bacterium]|nr:MAG: hypothetical protein HND58_07050 [Planctomycetota bacterium]